MKSEYLAESVDRSVDRGWVYSAIGLLEADANRSADTSLHRFPLPVSWGISLYLKDESAHPTGSLKHRLARSLFLYGLCNGWIHAGTTIIEASSGSTAVSEAYFARLLGLSFVAVVPRTISAEKLDLIRFHGGTVHLIDNAATLDEECRRLAAECDGLFVDQFTYAERATDWRGNNNIAESMFNQMAHEPHPVPDWVVVGAGTGGTSATLGRYIRYRRLASRVCVVDPVGSAFFPGWCSDDANATGTGPSLIEGIGRPRVESSFLPNVVDRMVQVPDVASIAAMRWGTELIGLNLGGSTGANLWAAMQLISEMKTSGRSGSVVSLLCDSGDRYRDSLGNDAWLKDEGIDITGHLAELRRLVGSE